MNSYYNFSKILGLFSWFVIIPGIISFVSLPYIFEASNFIQQQISVIYNRNGILDQVSINPSLNIKLSLPSQSTLKSGSEDYRAFVLDTYFAKYNSPLVGSGKSFVNACNKYGAPYDCTTLAGIAFVETRLCTLALSAKQRNCWGFGGSGSNRITFKSFDEAIDLITNRLVNSYGNNYILNPEKMQSTYCGPQCTSWAKGVNNARAEIIKTASELNLPPMRLP
jgi:hypothetical protein